MSRVINQLEVCTTSFFDGAVTLKNTTNPATGQVTLNVNNTGNATAVIRDLGVATDYFVFENLAQTLSSKTLVNPNLINPKVNAILDTNNNVALNIVAFGGSNQTTNSHLVLDNSTAGVVLLQASGATTNIDISLQPQGSGRVKLGPNYFPSSTGLAGQILQTDGAGNISYIDLGAPTSATFQTNSGATTYNQDLIPNLPINSAAFVSVVVVGATNRTDDVTSAAYEIKAGFSRGNGVGDAVRVIGSAQCLDLLSYEDTTAWGVNLNSDGSSVRLVVVGDNSDTVTWKYTAQINLITF
jgi:hypothetical protein